VRAKYFSRRIDLDQKRRSGICGYQRLRIQLNPVRPLTSQPRPPIRNCPACGVAMQASKSRECQAHFDKFECLNCRSVINEAKPRSSAGSDKPR
jgi:hypothetical protein